jgi:hypothetical protein
MWDELLGCLEDFAELSEKEGCVSLALQLSAAVHRARDKLALKRTPRDQALQEKQVANYRRATTNESSGEAWLAGLGWGIEEAVSAALEGAEVAARAG